MKILGINRRYLPAEYTEYGDGINITCVLVEGIIGDYSAYEGIGSPEWVATSGNKISFEEAKAQFPSIEKKKYRL